MVVLAKHYNVILDKCIAKHGDNLKNVTGKEVDQFLMEAKNEFSYFTGYGVHKPAAGKR